MSSSLVEQFFTSPHRWLIVTAVTFGIALVSVLPLVDQLLAERSERHALQEQLVQARQTAEELPLYEQRVAEKLAELDELREYEVDDEHLTELRSWLVNAARQAGCRVRRIDLAQPNRRSWTNDDNPLELAAKAEGKKQQKTPFDLQTRSVALSVTGSSAEVRSLLRTLDEDRRLKHAHAIGLKPESRNTNELQLDLTLWYFALVRRGGVA